jgi:hypothetical protein
MRKRLRLRRLGAVSVVGALAAAVGIMATAPGVNAASPEREYTAAFEAPCVVGPGVLNIRTKAKIELHSMVPTSVSPGESFMLKKAHSSITTPVELTENFVAFGATEVTGVVTRLILDATGAEPPHTNIAKPGEFPNGLPFIAPVEKGKPGVFTIPSLKLGETGLTYTAGTWTVTAGSGVVKISLNTEPGFTESGTTITTTGNGIVSEVEGKKEGTRTIGPVTVVCNPPSGVAPLEIPIVLESSLEQGHPELYENGKLGPEKATAQAQTGFGQLQFSSPQIGGIAECVVLGFGAGWNEGSPRRAIGQIFGWGAGGHIPAPTATSGELTSSCRAASETNTPGSFMTDEGFIRSEANEKGEVEPKRRRLSVPWNAEAVCGIREEVDSSIIRVGVPNGEFPRPTKPCPPASTLEPEKVEAEEHLKEREEKKGCYATDPAPEGCLRLTVVVPAAGLEAAFGGTLWAHELNGAKNGLSASRWKLEGAEHSGALQCEFPAGCVSAVDTAAATGELKDIGYKEIQLVTLR